MKKPLNETLLPPAVEIITIIPLKTTDKFLGGKPEYDADIKWSPVTAEAFRNSFHEYSPEYPLIAQFIDAAMQQPEAVFGFRAGDVDLPILLSFRPAKGGLCIGTASPDWFSSAGPDADEDEDDPGFISPGTVESTVFRLLLPGKSPVPVKEGLGWKICVPRHRRAQGMAESISTAAAAYLVSLSQRSLTIREGKETYSAIFKFEEDAKEFARILGAPEPLIEDQAEKIALRLLREE